MASLESEDLLAIKPSDVRVRLSLTDPAQLQTRDVRLALDFVHSGGAKSNYKFHLEMLSNERKTETSSWFNDSKSKSVYVFKLTSQSSLEFATFQREFLKQGKPKKYHWTVYYHLIKQKIPMKELTIDMELKLGSQEGYIYLLKNAPLSVN
jgi:hypothetical protein